MEGRLRDKVIIVTASTDGIGTRSYGTIMCLFMPVNRPRDC